MKYESDCGNYPDDWPENDRDIADSKSGKQKHWLAIISFVAGVLVVLSLILLAIKSCS